MSDHGRPGAGPRHGSSWMQRMHRKHDKKHHPTPAEEEPLLPDENAEEEPHQHQEHRRLAALRDKARVVFNAIITFFKSCFHTAVTGASWVFKNILRNITSILAVLTILLTMASVGLALGWAIDHKLHHPPASNCTSNTSSHAATRIMMSLAPRTFNQYACSRFEQHRAVGRDQSILSTIKILDGHNLVNFEKLRSSFHACKDEKNIANCGFASLKGITEKVKSKFRLDAQQKPLRTAAHSQFVVQVAKKGFTDAVVYMSRMDIASVISFHIVANNPNSDEQVITVHPSSLTLRRKDYHNKKAMAKWKKTLAAILPFFFDAASSERCAFSKCGSRISMPDMIKGIMAFETKLADTELSDEDLYSPKSSAELEVLMPQISFATILRELAPSGYNTSFLLAPSPASLQSTSKIIFDTPKEIVQAYLVWKTVQEYASRG